MNYSWKVTVAAHPLATYSDRKIFGWNYVFLEVPQVAETKNKGHFSRE